MFLVFSLITLGGAISLLLQRNAILAGLCMLLCFFGIAGLFLLLSNPVAAALHVIVYSGAITILVLFVVMLLQAHKEEAANRPMLVHKILSIVLVLALSAGVVLLVGGSQKLAAMEGAIPRQSATQITIQGTGPNMLTLQQLGEHLFNDHLVALEAVGLLLLAAMVAAVLLVKKEAK
jgi:NADH-quinone oxidoreductase subunit J